MVVCSLSCVSTLGRRAHSPPPPPPPNVAQARRPKIPSVAAKNRHHVLLGLAVGKRLQKLQRLGHTYTLTNGRKDAESDISLLRSDLA